MATTDGTRKATPHDGSRTNGQVYARVGTKGQFVVPAKLRQELHIEPGQRVRLEAKDGKLIVTPLNGNMIQREHQEEIEREEAQEALWREREREKAEKERERAERPPRDVLQEFLTRRDRGE
jgi:AbrB family looped-hinge helix DNA binding protein